MKIGLIDPALYRHDGTRSPNIGDLVISRAVHRELRSIFGPNSEIVPIPSHDYPSGTALKAIEGSDHVFVGGSNLLYFRWWRPTSWKIGARGLACYRDLILMGTGWGAYGIKANAYGRWVCRRILSASHRHSVRDAFTARIVGDELHVPKVANTACPTMWGLTADHVASIPRDKARDCIFSLTDYARDPQADGSFIRELERLYGADHVLFWPQGLGDADYARSLGYSGRVIERSLPALLALLSSGERLDYVGTRLHAGILCLEHRVRTVVLSIDNRAREIAADTGLPAIDRGDTAALAEWVHGQAPTQLALPEGEIAAWRAQFRADPRLA